MKTVAEKIKELREKEAKVKGMGGAKAVEKQHASGKLTARERLDLFFDPGTFRETDIFVTHRCVNFGMEKIEIPADGVVTGFGKVNGTPCSRSPRILPPGPAPWARCIPRRFVKSWTWP